MDAPTVWPTLQTVSPTAVLDLPGIARAAIAFVLILVVGAAILWRYGGVVDRSIEASIDRPLSSMGYGVAAHATILFFGVYAASQLGQLPVSGPSLGALGIWAGVILLLVVGALGFTVVGTAVVELKGDRHRWRGLLVGALLAGAAGLVEPVIGVVIWVVAVSTGIGGPVRTWFHASEDVSE